MARDKKSVGIIGAGAAGICSAKHMLEANCSVTVYEIGSKIGGMWVYNNDSGRSSAYKTLYINTPRELTNFSDYRFNSKVQAFPSHWDIAQYLSEYSDKFGVTSLVRFNTEVVSIRPAESYTHDRPRWRLETKAGEVFEHDTVIVATGHLTKLLDVPVFRDDFKGQYLHSHHYKDPADFVGKRVCVVGIGNSALDIASDLAVTSSNVTLVARSSALIIPKLMFGRPFWEIIRGLYKPWIPGWIRNKLVKLLVYIVQGNMVDMGFPSTAKRVHATSNANIVNHIKYRRVRVRRGIDKIDGCAITFVDGVTEEFDTLIAATGYLIDLDLIDSKVVAVENNTLDLYMRMVPPKWRGLYFVGFLNADTALNWLCEGQIRWIREMEMGRAKLPSESEMIEEIARRKNWTQTRFKDTPRHTIEVEHLSYFADLRRTMRDAQRRVGQPKRNVGIGAVNTLPYSSEGN